MLKLITLKVPSEVLAEIDAEAKRKGMSRTSLLLQRWTEVHVGPLEIEAARVSDRPPHAETCKCLICKPPK